uniref:Uncharacterized protein n=1 Tax=Timema cristinae TaxID=61476 RepID=A0A7R9CGI9_TIMCR|nr:unnamed protein product [Timema cristinae]
MQLPQGSFVPLFNLGCGEYSPVLKVVLAIRYKGVPSNNLTGVNDLIQYDASKQAVTVLTEGLRLELVQLGSKIRVTSIKPGCVKTNTLRIALHHNEEAFANIVALKGKDIADAVLYTLSTPPHVQVHEITIKPFTMERWSGRVALVTGASAGIGAAIVRELVKNGLIVVGLARRAELVEALSVELKGASGKLHALKGDASKEEDILAAFDWIKKNLGRIDVLVNNAGVLYTTSLTDGDTSHWKQIFDLNVLGLSICTREAFKLMKENGVDDGHIIHINSILGHKLGGLDGLIPYTASKHAVTVLTEGLRRELVQLGSKIRVTRWSGRVALVTGASAGIGAAVVRELVKNGLIVVGLARRAELVEELSVELKGASGKLHALKGDLTKEEDILAAFDWIKKNLGRIDILVNNAGVLYLSMLTDGETSHWKQIFDLNVLGLSICTREAFKLMKENGVDDGHIIHINRRGDIALETNL